MEPVVPKDLAFRGICTDRFLSAIIYSVVLQYLLMAFFLLFVNFNILHPIVWITTTVRLLLSVYTWLVPMPLGTAVIVHGIVLTRPCLLEERYHRTNFAKWYSSILQHSISLASKGTVGCLTAWLYTRFLRDDYRLLFLTIEDQSVFLNERFIYLFICGLFAGCYCFATSRSTLIATDFRLFSLRKVVQFRNSFYRILPESVKRSFAASLMYISFHFVFSLLCRHKIASLVGVVRLREESFIYNFYSMVTDLRLLLFSWLLVLLILTNMHLMHVLFEIVLNEPKQFSIAERTYPANVDQEPLLADALAYTKIPLVQQLAAEDLVLIADTENDESNRRSQLYLLSNPGGHPKNWQKLYDVCIKLIRDFTHELDMSIDGLDAMPPPPMIMVGGKLRATSSLDHERFLRRQYNQNFGVRSLSTPLYDGSSDLTQVGSTSEKKVKVGMSMCTLQSLPGYAYLFEESEDAKSSYLLSVQTPVIIKIVQSLAAIACRSLQEDEYGVVQSDLPCIMKALLDLKNVVDKIGTKNLDVRKIDRNYTALKGAVKRSLYRLSITFKPYIKDILLDAQYLEPVQAFLDFHEI